MPKGDALVSFAKPGSVAAAVAKVGAPSRPSPLYFTHFCFAFFASAQLNGYAAGGGYVLEVRIIRDRVQGEHVVQKGTF